jgi:TonB family protein
MRNQFSFFLALSALAMSLSAFAQRGPVAIDPQTFGQHRDHAVPLIYPAIAKAAQVQGTVVVQLTIDTKGIVVATRVISGPPMLQQAAVDCVRQWTYRPFEKDRIPVPATGQVSLVFSLATPIEGRGPQIPPPPGSRTVTVKVGNSIPPPPDPNDPIAEPFFEAWQDCTRGVLAHNRDEATASTCRKAADLAAKFHPNQRFIERRAADVYAATALANAGNYQDALAYATEAVDVVKEGHDDDSGSNAAYSTRGTLEAILGDFAAADHDLTTAEDFERKAIDSAEKGSPNVAQGYRSVLVRDLRTHAAVLMKLNRPADAQAKLDQAARF